MRIRPNCYYEKVGGEVKNITDEIDFELPNGWVLSRIGSLLSVQTGASFKKEEASKDNTKIRVLRGGNISNNGYVFRSDDIFLDRGLISDNILLQKNDLLTPAVTSLDNVGKIARIAQNYDNVSAGGFVFICRPFYGDDVFSRFLLYAIQCPIFNAQIKAITKKSGSAFYNIGKERFWELIIPVPPLKEQTRIVERIHMLLSNIKDEA